MLRLYVQLSLVLCFLTCQANAGMVVGSGAAGGEPAAGTILLGDNTAHTGDGFNTGGTVYEVYEKTAATATWAESDATATVASIYIRFWNETDPNTTCKALLFNSSGSLLTNGASDSLQISTDGAQTWHKFDYTSKPTVTKSTTYRMGFVCGTSSYISVATSANDTQGPMRHTGGSVASPENVVPGSDYDYYVGEMGIYAVH